MISLFYKIRQRYKYFRMKDKPVLIYSMAKTGTNTVHFSLAEYVLLHRIYHLDESLIKTFNHWPRSRKKLHFKVKEQLENNDGGCKVITLTREQAGRDIADFFNTMEKTHLKQFAGDRKKIENMPIPELIDRYFRFKGISAFTQASSKPLTDWFDENLKKWFGIDVYAEDFDKSKGWRIYKNEKAEVLLIRQEDLNRVGKDIIRDFLNIRDRNFRLKNTNIGATKWYAGIYEEFKKRVVLPRDYLDRIYNSRYMRHFYTVEEIKEFRGKWQARSNNFDG